MILRLSISILGTVWLVACSEHPSETDATAVNHQSTAMVLKYKVTGMHCDACAQAIQAKLEKMDGVVEVKVSFDSSSAVVKTHDMTVAPLVLAAIENMQFGAEQVEPGVSN
jgi:copper chaperone CopZ